MPDLLLQPVGWLLFGPVEDLLSAPPWIAVPAGVAVIVGALWAGAGLGAAYDRLTAAARRALIVAALLTACAASPRAVPAPHPYRKTTTPGGTR